MKFLKINSSGNLYAIALILFFALFFTSCATQYNFGNSFVVPAAVGSVKVKMDKNNNYQIDLNVKRLADPKRLNPAKEVYVVWMETEQEGRKNIGQLKTGSSMLSSALKSSLKTVSSSKPLAFFITAEDNADMQYPAGEEVLRTTPPR